VVVVSLVCDPDEVVDEDAPLGEVDEDAVLDDVLVDEPMAAAIRV